MTSRRRQKAPSAGASRPIRVAERVRAELSEMLLRGKVRDPGAKEVIISDVKVSADLSHARVYLRTLAEADPGRRTRAVEALTRAAGFLRRELGPRLELRRVPELEFFWDELVDSANRMEAIFHEIAEGDSDSGEKETE